MKPHKGNFRAWRFVNYANGEAVHGTFEGHPQFSGKYGHSSLIVNKRTMNDGSIEIETLNSRYTLLPEESIRVTLIPQVV